MFDWKNFPWTDFQDLNLDWILRKIKELKTVDLPALNEKIDNVYDYIRENLPDIIAQLTGVIIDVTTVGAVGDGVTDDSDAVRQALTMGDIIYFPTGRYMLREIEVNKPCVIMGMGEDSVIVPTRKFATTNQFYTVFEFHDDVIIKNLKLWADNSVVTQTGPQMLNDAAFVARNIKSVIFDGVIFDHIFETYHLSVADTLFEDRHGMAVYTRDCDFVMFNRCEVREYGGEELIQIERGRPDFGGGFVCVTNCYFHDRHNGDTGSALNVLGGSLIFADNQIKDFDNKYNNGTDGGSLFNLCGAYTIIANNYFHNCYCGNYFDISENYYTKAEYALVIGNVIDGSARSPIHVMARKAWFKDNYIAGNMGIRSMIMTDDTAATLKYGGVYSVDPSTKFTFEDLIIEDNEFYSAPNPFGAEQTSSYDACLGLGQHPAGQDPVQPRITIRNNNFLRNTTNATKNTIFLASKVGRAYISGNLFKNTGVSYPTITGNTTAKAFISAFDVINYLNIIDNIFDASYDAVDDYFIFSGRPEARTTSYYIIANNVGVISHSTGSPSTVYAYWLYSSLPTAAQVSVNNNLNITDHN